MVEVYVEPSSLSSILVLDKELEPKPDMFRLQPNVVFKISFVNYLTYIRNLKITDNILMTKMETLKELISLYDRGEKPRNGIDIQAAFIYNIAFAVGKELHFAQKYGRGASNIFHTLSSGDILTKADVEEYYGMVDNDDIIYYLQTLKSRGFPIERPIPENILFNWKYAVICYSFAIRGNSNWYYNNKI